MPSAEFRSQKHLLIRANQNSDLIGFLEEFSRKRKIYTATFTAIGALKYAELGFFDQEKQEYQKITLDSPHEIAACIGNISLKDEKPFVHAHATLGDRYGNTKSGHLLKGIVFAAEIHLCKLSGQRLERQYDEESSLSLWRMK